MSAKLYNNLQKCDTTCLSDYSCVIDDQGSCLICGRHVKLRSAYDTSYRCSFCQIYFNDKDGCNNFTIYFDEKLNITHSSYTAKYYAIYNITDNITTIFINEYKRFKILFEIKIKINFKNLISEIKKIINSCIRKQYLL